jgi:uncharacterized protein (UPF0276 family)
MRSPIPAVAGIGLRPAHYADILAAAPAPAWIEVHPENYMCAGGPQHRILSALRERCALSFHGVGLSLGGTARPDRVHLARLKELDTRYRPEHFSEHLAWSGDAAGYLCDLLPVGYTRHALARVSAHVSEVQDRLGREILIENPSLYLRFARAEMSETEFLRELARRTGCGLLLDVNNVHVSAVNLGFAAESYLADFPLDAVGEIHLAGHRSEIDADGQVMLIDTHSTHVAAGVWDLYRGLIARIGPRPTLIEWDQELPAWQILLAEAAMADLILAEGAHYAAAE